MKFLINSGIKHFVFGNLKILQNIFYIKNQTISKKGGEEWEIFIVLQATFPFPCIRVLSISLTCSLMEQDMEWSPECVSFLSPGNTIKPECQKGKKEDN